MIAFAILVIAFAAWVTSHVAIVVGLVSRKPRWRAPLALFVVPLAPFFAAQSGLRHRAAIWSASLVVYAIALVRVLTT